MFATLQHLPMSFLKTTCLPVPEVISYFKVATTKLLGKDVNNTLIHENTRFATPSANRPTMKTKKHGPEDEE